MSIIRASVERAELAKTRIDTSVIVRTTENNDSILLKLPDRILIGILTSKGLQGGGGGVSPKALINHCDHTMSSILSFSNTLSR
jgi:hypothetical protein